MSKSRKQHRAPTPNKDHHAERVRAYAALVGAVALLIPVLVDAVLKLHLG